ncbi:MAG: hypothetical protein HYU03_01655 [Thaumarchaeota archaeon]|nr:hypothetical protein [Nitrososphaerota archaeon]
MVVGEGAIGYVRGRVYVSGGRKNPVLAPGNKWYPRLRIEMMDKHDRKSSPPFWRKNVSDKKEELAHR